LYRYPVLLLDWVFIPPDEATPQVGAKNNVPLLLSYDILVFNLVNTNMSELCTITPVSAFMSTNLSSKIECFQELGQRILRLLGHPMINVELHPDQLYDAISMSCEFFTKYAGYTKEFLIFDSKLYERDKGIRLDYLYTVANTGFTLSQKLNDSTVPNPDFQVSNRGNLYVSLSNIPNTYFLSSSALSGSIPDDGITSMQVLDETSFAQLTAFDPLLVDLFKISPQKTILSQCTNNPSGSTYNNMFDYDVMDYRKVIDVVDFEEGSSSGITSLFSMEQTLAQQTFYSYAMGNFGFDLLSWHVVKDWQDTREKLLAIRRDIHFDNRTQYLRFYPQPKVSSHFVGVLECYIERPLRDIIKEKWVLEYSVALSKVMWGRILTKINGVNLLGGGVINGDSILQEGVADKERLETMLIEGTGGYAAYEPVGMLVR
jgi:hypothetical protein